MTLLEIPIQFFGGLKNHYSALYNFFPSNVKFLFQKLIIQKKFYLKMHLSKFSTITCMHTSP